MRICALGSGSSGNCVYLDDGKNAILIDAGFSAKEIFRRMKARNLDPGAICAIVVSHEHIDHVRGAGPVARKLGIPVYINKPTYAEIKNSIGKLEVKSFDTGTCFSINGFSVTPFPTSHDCADPCAFVIETDGKRAGVVTDTGVTTMLMMDKLKNVDILVLEANHDIDMLKAGPYPWEVKQRIASRSGHLSNEASLEFAESVIHPGLQRVIFAHMSQTNNNPDLVRVTADAILPGAGTPYSIATQHEPTALLNVE